MYNGRKWMVLECQTDGRENILDECLEKKTAISRICEDICFEAFLHFGIQIYSPVCYRLSLHPAWCVLNEQLIREWRRNVHAPNASYHIQWVTRIAFQSSFANTVLSIVFWHWVTHVHTQRVLIEIFYKAFQLILQIGKLSAHEPEHYWKKL